jgi:HAE1 family hydrophobic/amphiphilic exporter-1
MGIIGFSLKRRVTVFMASVAVILFGLVAFSRLPINLLPDLSYPTVTVETRLPGAAPAEVEALVTRPVEELVGVVSGVQRLTSVSRPGLSQVTLEFGWGRDMDFASIDVREKLDLIRLPDEAAKPVLLRFDPANDPIVRLFLTGGDDLFELRYVAEEVLKKDLESSEGVAAIKVNGGYEEQIHVRVDQGKLALMGVPIQEVNSKLLRENVNQAGGSLYEEEARYLVRARNEFESLDDIRETVLIAVDGRQVRMADVAEVERGHRQRDVITRFGGDEAVELAIYKEGDANTVSVARSLLQRLDNVAGDLPEGVTVVTGVDQSRFIQASIREVLSNALIGGGFAIIVLLFFLKDVRSTLIIGASIPISVIATFFLMYQTGTTLNIMSLGGLALGVGMLVDSAIVVLEAIYRRREEGASAIDAAQLGASEVGRAVIASTLTTVAVFLPVVFLEGMAAQLFRDMALTVSFALVASLAVSLTLIPMLAALFLSAGDASAKAALLEVDPSAGIVRRIFRFVFFTIPAVVVMAVRFVLYGLFRGVAMLFLPLSWAFDRFLGGLFRAYPAVLRGALQARLVVVTLALVLFGGALALIPRLGMDLIPSFAQGEFSFRVELPEGTPLEITDRFVADVQSVLEDDPRVESFTSLVGGAGLSLTETGAEGENVGRIQVRMAPDGSRADEEAVIALLRERLDGSDAPRYKFERPSYFSFRTPIEVEVYSDDLDELHEVATVLHSRVADVDGMVDVKSSSRLGNPELQVLFNGEQLMGLGLDVGQVARTIRNKVQGEVATRFTRGDREIDVVVRSVELGEAMVQDVSDMIIGQRDGVPIYLSSVADVVLSEGPSEIRRIDQKRAAVITGNLDDRDMGAVAADIRDSVRSLALPGGASVFLSGQEEEMSRSLGSLLMAMALAVFLVYLVMASQFESFLHPFVIILSLPLGAVGVVAALLVTGKSIDVVAMIGVVMLAGIVVNNAIVLVDSINRRRNEGLAKREAIVKAGLGRMRPILMTSTTTILALLPMALGLGEGAELRSSLAITVIGGLAVATGLTLFVIPVIYSLVDRKVYEVDATDTAKAPARSLAGVVEDVVGDVGGSPEVAR